MQGMGAHVYQEHAKKEIETLIHSPSWSHAHSPTKMSGPGGEHFKISKIQDWAWVSHANQVPLLLLMIFWKQKDSHLFFLSAGAFPELINT